LLLPPSLEEVLPSHHHHVSNKRFLAPTATAVPAMQSFFIEALVEYAIAALIILLRFAVRWRVVGLRSFDVGDAFCLLALVRLIVQQSPSHSLTESDLLFP
jgi:hypothetical protein